MANSHMSEAGGQGINIGDILFTLFRHKKKIAICSLVGLGAALCVPLVKPRPYQSEAKLYIRYVLENRSPSQETERAAEIRNPDIRGELIIKTELEILTSMDIAQQVADIIGPDKILHRPGNADRFLAAALVRKNLTVDVPKESTVLRLAYQSRDPALVQPVLKQLIDLYFKKHAQMHALGAFDQFLAEETDQRRSRVATTEEDLRKAKSKIGIISLDETKTAYAREIARLDQEIVNAEVELAEHQSSMKALSHGLGTGTGNQTNDLAVTNVIPQVAPELLSEYSRICGLVENWRHREQELLLTYTASNALVREAHAQVTTHEGSRKDLEKQHPELVSMARAQTNSAVAAASSNGAVIDPYAAYNMEAARVLGLESKLRALKQQLAGIQARANALVAVEGSITELQRKLAIEETNYARFSQKLEQSQLDERLGAGKVSNISMIQEPTPPLAIASKQKQTMLIVFAAAIGFGIVLAFLLDMYLDPTVKRASEIESKLGLPLLFSIPLLTDERKQGRSREALQIGAPAEARNGHSRLALTEAAGTSEVGTASRTVPGPESLRVFIDTLRDRLMTYFEVKKMLHKPKLVAVTNCSPGSGGSTIAADLAASLSHTGEGNVLLVDMNNEDGGAARFHKGDLACGLDDVLDDDKRSSALIHENLYVAKEEGSQDNLPSVLPSRFKGLFSRLKASDFDYIIFDMPSVTQISITPRLSRFMDIVLLVVEAEKTGREAVKKAKLELQRSEANVAVVLNKTRQYIPARLANYT